MVIIYLLNIKELILKIKLHIVMLLVRLKYTNILSIQDIGDILILLLLIHILYKLIVLTTCFLLLRINKENGYVYWII